MTIIENVKDCPKIIFTSSMSVELVELAGSDQRICQAARVSTIGAASADTDESKGLLKFLLANRHGCYDSGTEVLTSEGWKFWPDVDGSEQFMTLNRDTDEMEYQNAQRLIRKRVDGPMVHIQMGSVDALVTPDHNMFAAPRTRNEYEYDLIPAHEFADRAHRIRLGGGLWEGEIHCPEAAALIGFIAADGHVGNTSVTFNLRKERKVDFLHSLGFDISEHRSGHLGVRGLDETVWQWAKDTYTADRDRCLPRDLLMRGDQETLQALLDGYLMGDGSVSPLGKVTASTISTTLVNDLQELALKTGNAMVQQTILEDRTTSFGTRPLHRLTFYRERNSQPRIGWTQEARERQVRTVEYHGEVHCVTVPNGVLYVRRNGKPMWSGNSPFEHGMLTFRISAPIFVWREFMRHRIGFSYNEESGRYKKLEPKFYVPGISRPLVQVGKPGAYSFVQGSDSQYEETLSDLGVAYCTSWQSYSNMLENGVAKEVARACLPVATYSTAYVTCNPRSLMSFLSLRTKEPDSTFPSYPQHEIEMVARQMEEIFAEEFPMTYQIFDTHGRVSP